jgi:hypothetical protein
VTLVAPKEFFARPQQPQLSDADKLQARLAHSGTLQEIIEIDPVGRRISRFFGDPAAWLDQFKSPARRVIGWRGRP